MLMAALLIKLGAIPRRAILVTAGVFVGSLLFGYSTVFYPYLPGIAACLAALTLVLSPPLSTKKAAAVGGLLGLALVFDFIFIIAVAVIGVFFLAALRPLGREPAVRRAGVAAAVGALPLGAFAIYCVSIFGSLSIPYRYEASDYFRNGMAQGVMGVTAPKPSAMWFLSVHPYRGILFWSPWLIMIIVCCIWLIRHDARLRPIAIASLVTLIGYFLFNAGYYQWWAGWGMGPRLMTPIFAIVPLALVAACRADSPRWLRIGTWSTLTIGVLLCLPLSMIDPQTPGGDDAAVLVSARPWTLVHAPQLNVLKNFYLLRWADIKPFWAIPIPISFVLCALVVGAGTTLAYRAAAVASDVSAPSLTTTDTSTDG
ncbi:unannotated protein [freshwater metagenome]|uniref:Unannotated protein n=1 Tax=freshwater metagenome TaxID=449393 RepID=A0A6J7FK83_9ZZZZ